MEEKAIEQHFGLSTFLYRSGLDHNEQVRMKSNLNSPDSVERNFDGLRIDACANRTSVFSVGQSQTYCNLFRLQYTIRSFEQCMIRGIGDKTESIGWVTIQITVKLLNVTSDVFFHVSKEDIPTLLSMKDMVDNGLDISIKSRYVSLRE